MALPILYKKLMQLIKNSGERTHTRASQEICTRYRISSDDMPEIMKELENAGVLRRGKRSLELKGLDLDIDIKL